MSTTDEKIKALQDEMVQSLAKNNMQQFIKGGKFIIDTLREVMERAGADVVYPDWLDTCDKELDKLVTK